MTDVKLRRIHVAIRMFPPDAGAAPSKWLAYVREISRTTGEVVVYTSKAVAGELPTLPRNVRVSRWPVLRSTDGAVRGYAQYLSFDIPLFFRLLFSPKPDIVISDPPPTTGVITRAAARMRGVPYVYFVSDLLADAAAAGGMNRAVVRVVAWLEKLAIEGATEVASINPKVALRVQQMTGRKSVVVPYAVTVPSRKTTSASTRNPADPIFLYSGTVTEWMGVEAFVDAVPLVLAAMPNARFFFRIQGAHAGKVHSRIERLSEERVQVLPPCSPQTAHAWEQRATVTMAGLVPGYYDIAYTTKVLTSLAAGTPVVYAGAGLAAEDLTTNDLGVVVPHDPALIAEALIETAEAVLAGDSRYDPERLRSWVESNYAPQIAGGELTRLLRRAAHGS